MRYLPHDRTFIEVFLNGAHLFTATPQLTLTADQEQEVIEKRKHERLVAQNRFTVANRQRKKNATGEVHRLKTDKDGTGTSSLPTTISLTATSLLWPNLSATAPHSSGCSDDDPAFRPRRRSPRPHPGIR